MQFVSVIAGALVISRTHITHSNKDCIINPYCVVYRAPLRWMLGFYNRSLAKRLSNNGPVKHGTTHDKEKQWHAPLRAFPVASSHVISYANRIMLSIDSYGLVLHQLPSVCQLAFAEITRDYVCATQMYRLSKPRYLSFRTC